MAKKYFAIQFESELKKGFYEKIDNDNFLFECETEKEIDKQMNIYVDSDKSENKHYLYNIFLVNEFYPGNDQTIKDDAASYAVYEKKQDNTLSLLYMPYLFNNTDMQPDEVEQFKTTIKLSFEKQHKKFLFCQLWKQIES